jgi:hypothetical protein
MSNPWDDFLGGLFGQGTAGDSISRDLAAQPRSKRLSKT